MNKIQTLSWIISGLSLLGLGACYELDVDAVDMAQANTPTVQVIPNYAGTNSDNGLDPELDDLLIQFIDRADATIDFAVMGFSRHEIIDALERAHNRGVQLRFVGDARYLEHHQLGYETMESLNIPMMVGRTHVPQTRSWMPTCSSSAC